MRLRTHLPTRANGRPRLRLEAMRDERGVTMIVALLVMLVTSLLLVAAFTATNGDTQLTRADQTQKQAYYAALAGAQEYEYDLEANPDFWESCPHPSGTAPGELSESYEVTTLAAASDTEAAKTCNTANPFTSIIESKGALTNTFRIKSVGKSGTSKRTVIATFQVAGFLNYIYFTQYEVADPRSYPNGEAGCENYAPEREKLMREHKLNGCSEIEFGPEDSVNGPMKTDDKPLVCNGAEFGRAKHSPADPVEIGFSAENQGNCTRSNEASPVYNTANGKPTVGAPELVPPESDGSLKAYVEAANEFTGLTYLELEGATNEIKVKQGTHTEKIKWPANGLIYVQSGGSGCGYTGFSQTSTDTSTTLEEEKNCGSVYVKGTSSATKSLTIAAEEDLIIDGSIRPSGLAKGAAPTGTATVGLIATRYVRMYHPCTNNVNGNNSEMENPWIYAAILSTSHSFLVDNYNCGNNLGDLNIYGAIAQKFRGIVGTVGGSGYIKEYIYDERLATDEPPYFLAPLKAGWKIARETASAAG
jgi:Tfp pilus assembly protein PilX